MNESLSDMLTLILTCSFMPMLTLPYYVGCYIKQTSNDKVPKLNLSIVPMASSQHNGCSSSNGEEKASPAATTAATAATAVATSAAAASSTANPISCSARRRERERDGERERSRGGSKQPLHSPRVRGGGGGDTESREEASWDEELLKKASPSKSPRASVLKDSLKYTQSSKSGEGNSIQRVLYQQQKPKNSPQLRSESAKAR